MSVGLLLQGGAMRGMYTAGVLDVFLENNIKIDGIIGVSAGVLFGIDYCSKQKGRSIRYSKKFARDKRYMGIRSLITTGNIVNKDFAYYELPSKLDIFDEDAYEKSNIDFYATITNVNTGKPEYVKIENAFEQMEVLRATSAMPFVSKFVSVGEEKYLDGGLADNLPIDKIKELRYDKIIVVLTRPRDYRKTKSNHFITKLKYRKHPNLVRIINNRYINYNDSIEKILDGEKKKEIFVIGPSRTLKIKRMERNPEKLQEMYDLGVEDCKANLNSLKEYLCL